MKDIVLATASAGKLREFAASLADCGLQAIPQTALGVSPVSETGLTFIENALIKARHAAKMTGMAAIADDSGLTVDALKGAPGIYSARYAGENASDEENCRQLLLALQHVPEGQRQAQFHCVLVYLSHADSPVPQVFHGCWHGSIARQASGQGGFGYDPLFFIPALHCSAAQLDVFQKNTLSHRGQALRQLIQAFSSDHA